MKTNNVIKNLVTVAISTISCLILLEGVVRVYSIFFFPKMMLLDDKLGWKHANNARKIFLNEEGEKVLVMQNTHGHRGKPYEFSKQHDKYRILMLGDSFTEGVHVKEEDLLSAQLEKVNPFLEVINAGVGGYSTVQEYLYLLTEGLKFNPDLVILMFFENDLSDNCLSAYAGFGPRPYATFINNEVSIIEKPDQSLYFRYTIPAPFRMKLYSPIYRHSYLYYFLTTKIYHVIFSEKMRQLQKEELAKTEDCGKYEIFYEILQKINRVTRENNGDFFVTLIPTRDDTNKGYSQTHSAIMKFCQENTMKCLPLIERFNKENLVGNKLYFSVDIHWTKVGHRIAAEEMSAFLRALLPPHLLQSSTP